MTATRTYSSLLWCTLDVFCLLESLESSTKPLQTTWTRERPRRLIPWSLDVVGSRIDEGDQASGTKTYAAIIGLVNHLVFVTAHRLLARCSYTLPGGDYCKKRCSSRIKRPKHLSLNLERGPIPGTNDQPGGGHPCHFLRPPPFPERLGSALRAEWLLFLHFAQGRQSHFCDILFQLNQTGRGSEVVSRIRLTGACTCYPTRNGLTLVLDTVILTSEVLVRPLTFRVPDTSEEQSWKSSKDRWLLSYLCWVDRNGFLTCTGGEKLF